MARTPSTTSAAPVIKKSLRCAVYTRKSTEDGLEQEFNSLHAQRDACEAYIASQKSEGWTALADRYDDGGFSGGNVDRPALKQLIADIQAGKIDVVVVYKLDRFSRSIADFHKLMEIFTQYNVAFVSITQQFNTTTSMGRMVLNMLLTFAQFERELIGERTRDKIAAARRKGRWSGGMPMLGYDVNERGKLAVNPAEAVIVRGIFELYIQEQSLIAVLKELAARGWKTKQWTTRKQTVRGGKGFDKVTLYRLLQNVVYRGQVRYKTEVHPGEQEGIISAAVWERVQTNLKRNARAGGVAGAARNRYGALLRGLLHCTACNCAMVHGYTSKGPRQYRYYICMQAQKRGWHTCPSKSVPAGQIEQFVVGQIQKIGQDPALVAQTILQARKVQLASQVEQLASEESLLQKQLKTHALQITQVAARGGGADRLVELEARVQHAQADLARVQGLKALRQKESVDQTQVAEALAAFHPVWEALTLKEQARLVALLVARVDYDGPAGEIRITFCPSGIRSLVQGTALVSQEIAA